MMENKESKIYCGSAKKSKYGLKLNINLDRIPSEFITGTPSGRYTHLEVNEMKQPDKFGYTHCITVDTWKPEPKKEVLSPSPGPEAGDISSDDLPF